MQEVRVVIGTGKDGTTMEQLADSIADGMNKVNDDANKNRVKKGQTFRPTLMQYLKENPDKTVKDYKQEFGL